MFAEVETVSFDEANDLLLHRPNDKPWRLERSMVQLILHASSIEVSTRIDCEHFWRDPQGDTEVTGLFNQADLLKTVPYPAVSLRSMRETVQASATALPENARVFAFQKEHFLGEIADFRITIGAGEKHHCHTLIWEDTLSVACLLTEDVYSRLLRHAYLSAADFELRLVLGVTGFQFAHEAAYAEPNDMHHLVIQGDRAIPSEVRVLSVQKARSVRGP